MAMAETPERFLHRFGDDRRWEKIRIEVEVMRRKRRGDDVGICRNPFRVVNLFRTLPKVAADGNLGLSAGIPLGFNG